jgi:hypothetical protein
MYRSQRRMKLHAHSAKPHGKKSGGHSFDIAKNSSFKPAGRTHLTTCSQCNCSGEPGRTRTYNPLLKSETYAVQDVRNVLRVQQNAFCGHKLLRAFYFADWTLRSTVPAIAIWQTRSQPILRRRKSTKGQYASIAAKRSNRAMTA